MLDSICISKECFAKSAFIQVAKNMYKKYKIILLLWTAYYSGCQVI